ncbi:MAG TPA: Holliday junction branch migration DNA helicase RuvB [Patescibacteria group bacterium]|nr:Holliday junction branch migration DNA helicase RuvB [Patescibacteria group bacterium]
MAIKKEKKRLVSGKLKPDEIPADSSLRPSTLAQFAGQDNIKENLKIMLEAARKRKEPLEHILLYGPAGIGKTSMAQIMAHEMSANIKITSGPTLDRPGDLASILTSLSDFDILFIDEIHRLGRLIEELLYPAMEDYALDIIIGKGPSAKTLRLELPKFTVIGATTKIGGISSPLRDRFGAIFKLDYYKIKDVKRILKRAAKILRIPIDNTSIILIAKSARRTPRIANRILRRVRDYAQVRHQGKITPEICLKALKMLQIDSIGLDKADRKLLEILIKKFSGGPVGLETLAAASSEDIANIEEVYEPYLMRLGFLKRTPKGRMATSKAFEYLGFKCPQEVSKKAQKEKISRRQKKLFK